MALSSMEQKLVKFPEKIEEIAECIRTHGKEAARLFYDYNIDDLTCSGYHETGGGLTLSYGIASPNVGGYVSFPMSFRTSVLNVSVILLNNKPPEESVIPVESANITGFRVSCQKDDLIQFVAWGL